MDSDGRRMAPEHGVITLNAYTATAVIDVDPWGREIRAVYRHLREAMSSYTELAVLLMVHDTKPGRNGHGISRVIDEWGRQADIVITLEQAGTDHVQVSTHKRLKVRRQLILRQHNGLLGEPRL